MQTTEPPPAGPAAPHVSDLPKIEELRNRTEAYVREQPVKAVSIALGAGVLLAGLPIFSLFGGIVRMILGLLRPLLLVLGALKLYEEYQKRQTDDESDAPSQNGSRED